MGTTLHNKPEKERESLAVENSTAPGAARFAVSGGVISRTATHRNGRGSKATAFVCTHVAATAIFEHNGSRLSRLGSVTPMDVLDFLTGFGRLSFPFREAQLYCEQTGADGSR